MQASRVRLASRTIGGGDFRDLEPRVRGEQLDEALADGAGGAEDSDGDLLAVTAWASP